MFEVLQNNWFRTALIFILFVFLAVFTVFTLKYQPAPAEPPRIIQVIATSTSAREGIDLPAVISSWYPGVVRIECFIRSAGGDLSVQSGSGLLFSGKSGTHVLTNRHVVAGEGGELPELCSVRLPNDEDPYVARGIPTDSGGSNITLPGRGLDWALIAVTSPPESFRRAARAAVRFCSRRAELGTAIVIMGYPSVGAATDVTVTQGIVSGYEEPYLITDARIGHGNSGGIAVSTHEDSKASCLIGIPTFTEVGQVLNLGRILDIRSIVAELELK